AITALVATALGHPVKSLWLRLTGVAMLVLAIGSVHALWFPNLGPVAGMEAGMVPQWITGELSARFSGLATSLILICAAVIGAVVAADEVVFAMPGAILRGLSFLEPVWQFDYAKFFAPALAKLRGGSPQAALATGTPPSPAVGSRTRTRAANVRVVQDEDQDEDDRATNARVAEADDDVDTDEDAHEVGEVDEAEDADGSEDGATGCDSDDDSDDGSDGNSDDSSTAARRSLSAEELRAKIACLPVRMANAPKVAARDEDIPRAENYEGYQFPTLDLLEDPDPASTDQMEEFVRNQAQMLEQTLQTYEIEGEVTGIESGPVVTLYSVELAPGTRVARLNAISTDIARALSAPNVRIISNMVGRTAVGIEVPNKHKEKVRLKELMSGPAAEGMALPMFLGKDSSGQALVVDLARQPHMLIAGTTGSGKSVCMNTIIMSWLYTKRPDELKLCLVDPKMVEMAQFSNIPHLMCPVVTDMEKAAGIMEWAVGKMEERYELLKRAEVRDIRSFNALGEEKLKERIKPVGDLDWARTPKKLPYMVFVIDELADLMMQHKEVETFIVRIAQKARAVGMHLVLATQRPQANVVTGLIKSNMPCRVSFKVASAMDSRIVLDQKGGELLLGNGDMLVVTPITSDLRRAQGTLVTDGETRDVATFLKEVAAPTFERTLET
ncbi:MAG: DNA translocase FtsK, partial [Phycisphaerae bacterium]|nr:DNA translocase FtsK [Phycisphaerae bacterium]